jgi:hypothetical protein
MALRTLGVVLFLAATFGATPQDDRKADRDAIRAHIDSIFQAFIKKDAASLRATHAKNWLGYLEGSRTMISSVDGYMDWNQVDPASPYGMKSYKMREFDMIFKGDAAFVCFVADVESNTPTGPSKRALRISDFYTKQDGKWLKRRPIVRKMGAAQFAKDGGKLVKLEFPKTEIQVYGFTAVVYSSYLYELENRGKRAQQSGRVTEVFVLRKGQWVNPGWHMDSGK